MDILKNNKLKVLKASSTGFYNLVDSNGNVIDTYNCNWVISGNKLNISKEYFKVLLGLNVYDKHDIN